MKVDMQRTGVSEKEKLKEGKKRRGRIYVCNTRSRTSEEKEKTSMLAQLEA